MYGNLCHAENVNAIQREWPDSTSDSIEDFDSTYYYILFNLTQKNTAKALAKADILYKSTTVPEELARVLMLKGVIFGKSNKPIVALEYVDRALKIAKENKQNDLLVWGYYYKGELYRSLSFYVRGNLMLEKAESLISKINNEFLRDSFKAVHIKGKAEMAKANGDYKKVIKLFQELISNYKKWESHNPDAAVMLGRSFQILGDCYFQSGDTDNAMTSYQHADKYLNKGVTKNTIYMGRIYRGIGDVYLERSTLDSAQTYLLQSLSIAQESNSNSFKVDVYKSLKSYYKKINNLDQFLIYDNKEDSISNIIEKDKRSFISKMAEYPLARDKKLKPSKDKEETNRIVFILIIAMLFIAIIAYFLMRSRKKEKEMLFSKAENEFLEQRLEAKFNELMDLVRANDSSFLAKFKLVYPQLFTILTKTLPPLTDSEIKLCAMVWLKLSSKEIARFTFVQHKTVQTKKYRIRKKLGLPIGQDLYDWMLSLIEKENTDLSD